MTDTKPTADLHSNPSTAKSQLMLVYDSSCGFCSRAIQFILRHEHRHDLLFVPRDSPLGEDLRRAYHLEAVESMVWIEGGQAAIESGAVLHAAGYVGGGWSALAFLGAICPAALRNYAYRWIARNRRRLSRGASACLIPTARQRARFLS